VAHHGAHRGKLAHVAAELAGHALHDWSLRLPLVILAPAVSQEESRPHVAFAEGKSKKRVAAERRRPILPRSRTTMATAVDTRPPPALGQLRDAALRHITYHLGTSPDQLEPREAFRAVALAVRDLVIDRMLATEQRYRRASAKRVYYLSLEFLIGRSLHNNLV